MDLLDPAMIPVYRAMSPAARIQAGLDASDMVRDRLRAEFSHRHPLWSDREVEEAVVRRLLGSHDGG
jgi:hypothetical protein